MLLRNNHLKFKGFALIGICAIGLSFVAYASADTPVGGDITEPTIWSVAGEPYIVTSNVNVLSGVTLTIEPGVRVKFNGNYTLTINGTLIAQGNPGNLITFSSNLGSPAPGNWYRIHLNSASSASALSYLDIQHSAFGLYLDNTTPTATMTNITASNNHYGISFDNGSSPTVTNITANNNVVAGFYILRGAAPLITNSESENNSSYGVYVYNDGSTDPNPVVNQSSLVGNTSYEVWVEGFFNNPNARLDFKQNWWGTTDTNVINSKIYDHFDGAGLPYIDYPPFLDSKGGTPVAGTYVGGTIEPGTIWASAGNPFIVYQNVTVPSGVTLTIEPGVLVKFAGNFSFNASGVLNAQGTAVSHITFTSNQVTPAPGNWFRISLSGGGSSASQLTYCDIEYANWGLHIDNSSPSLSHVTLSNNSGYGFFLDNNAASMMDNVSATNTQIGFYLDNGAAPTITNSQSSANSLYGVWLLNGAAPMITTSDITGNFYGFFIQRGTSDPNPVVNRSSIYGNAGNDVRVENFGNPNAHLDFTENWWGTTTTSSINSQIFDHFDNGNSPYVDYVPFLDSPGGNPVTGTYVGGPLAENTTWTSAGNPFIVYQNVTVPAGVTLIIQDGVQVKFDGNHSLIANGVLNAQGTAVSPITFTSNNPTPAPGNWYSVSLNGLASSGSQLSYCTFQYASFGLYLDNSSPTLLNNLTATNNSYGFYMDNNASPSLSESSATNNTYGFYLDNSSSPTITQSTISNNNYGFLILRGSSPTITYSSITNSTWEGIFIGGGGGPDPNPTVNRSSLYGSGGVEVRVAPYFGGFVDPNGHLDLTENWWGTTNRTTVESEIIHHPDNVSVPYVDYIPYLDGPDGNIVLVIHDISVTSGVFNPVAGETAMIHYSLSKGANATVKIYSDATRSLVRTLIDAQPRGAAQNTEIWDGKDDALAIVPEEAYYFTILADDGAGQTGIFNDPLNPLMGPFPLVMNPTVDATNFDPYQNLPMLLTYTLSDPGRVGVDIVPPLPGPIIRNLLVNAVRIAGNHTEYWDGRKNDGAIYVGDFNVLYPWTTNIPLYPLIVQLPDPVQFGTLQTEAYLIIPLFDEVSTISYTLDQEASVFLEIQDPNGNHFRTLVNNPDQPVGSYSQEWDGKNDAGEIASVQGAYKVILTAIDTVSGQSWQRVGTTLVYR